MKVEKFDPTPCSVPQRTDVLSGEEQVLLDSFDTAESTNLSHTDSTWGGMTGASGVLGASFPEVWGAWEKMALQLYPG